MKIGIVSITLKGRELSYKMSNFLLKNHSVDRYCYEKNSDENACSFDDIRTLINNIFSEYDALIFICAVGIAVRCIAGNIKSKVSDPAVIVADDSGKFVISLLSGHIGGANRLAEIIAENTGAIPVITTATDTGKKFSPDTFAKANNLVINDMETAKKIASAVLNGEKTGLLSEYPYKNLPDEVKAGTDFRYGIYICENNSDSPFEITLRLVPKNLVVGIGCKRGTECEKIEKCVKEAFLKNNICTSRICSVATIDIKADEKGLMEYCEKKRLTMHTYTSQQLMETKGEFTVSDFVKSVTGTDNVCERSAVKHSGGKLVIKKYVAYGVTVAVATLPVEIDFERKIL